MSAIDAGLGVVITTINHNMFVVAIVQITRMSYGIGCVHLNKTHSEAVLERRSKLLQSMLHSTI